MTMPSVDPSVGKLTTRKSPLEPIYHWAIPFDLWKGDVDKIRKAKINIAFAYAIAIWGPVFSSFHFFIFKSTIGAISVFTACILMLTTPWIMKKTHSIEFVGNYVTAVLYAVLAVTAVICGGHGQPPLTWQVAIPMIAICLGNSKSAPAWIFISVGTIVFFYIINRMGIVLPHHFTPEAMNLFDVMVLSALVILITSFSLLYESEKEIMLDAAKTAKEEAEQTLSQLRQTQSQLIHSEKMSALGAMATGVAHEINNPLAIISFNTQFLAKSLTKSELDPTALKNRVEMILKSVERASKITRGLLAFSHGSGEEEFTLTPLSETLEETLFFCEKLLDEKGIELRTHIQNDLSIQCKKVQLSQVILNLLTNSLHALEDLTEKWIEIDSQTDGKKIKIAITDSGMGIPEETRHKIFDPFFTTKPIGKGTGLGLSISRRILLSHQGTLYLDEKHPHTRFVMELPISPTQQSVN